MSGPGVSANLRVALKRRANARCEYCLVPDGAVMWPHEPDHIIAEQHGGHTELANLALACFHCNRRKICSFEKKSAISSLSCCNENFSDTPFKLVQFMYGVTK